MSSNSSTRKYMGAKGGVKSMKGPPFRIQLQCPRLPVCGRIKFRTFEECLMFADAVVHAQRSRDEDTRNLLIAGLMNSPYVISNFIAEECPITPPCTPPAARLVGVEPNPGPLIIDKILPSAVQETADKLVNNTVRFVHAACVRAGLCEADAERVEREYLQRNKNHIRGSRPLGPGRDKFLRREKERLKTISVNSPVNISHFKREQVNGEWVTIPYVPKTPPASPLVGIEPNPGPFADKKHTIKSHRVAPAASKSKSKSSKSPSMRKQGIPNNLSLSSGNAPAARSFKTTMRSAQYYHAEGGGLGLVRREYITDVLASNTAFAFNSTVIQGLNPGNPSLFPWVSTMAVNYGEYRFKKVQFSFCSEVSSATGGSFSIGATSDPTDPQPNSKTAIYQYKNSTRCNLWENCTFDVPPLMLRRLNRFIVSTKSTGYTEQDMLKQCGGIFWATDGASASVACGEVWVTYTLELYNEQPSTSVSAYITGTPIVSAGSANPSFITNPYTNLGLLPITNVSNDASPSGYTSTAAQNSIFVIKKGGSYMFTTIWTGTVITSGDTWAVLDQDGDAAGTFTAISQQIATGSLTLISIFRFESNNTSVVEDFAQLGNPIFVYCNGYPACTTMTNLKIFVTPMGISGSGDLGNISGQRINKADQITIRTTALAPAKLILCDSELCERNDDDSSSPGPKTAPKGRYVFVEEPGD